MTKVVYFSLYRDEAHSRLSVFVFVLKALHSQSEWISVPGKGRVVRIVLLYRNAVSASAALKQAPFTARLKLLAVGIL